MVERILAWILARVWRRVSLLALMAVFGMLLAFGALHLSEFLLVLSGVEKMKGVAEKLITSLHVIVLGLPVVTTLWWFRTNDTLEQIQKTKESTDVSILFGAQQMMFEDDGEKPGIKTLVGFAQLMLLRQQGSHKAVIDLATRDANLAGLDLYPISMREANLYRANLQKSALDHADLRRAELHSANLTEADLVSANLQGAFLTWAVLQKADLRYAELQGADLKSAKDISGAKFEGAKYSDETQFPDGFDPEKAGMIKVP